MAAPAVVETARSSVETNTMNTLLPTLRTLALIPIVAFAIPTTAQEAGVLGAVALPSSADSSDGVVPLLNGTWAHEFVTTSVSDVPFIGSLRATTRTLLRLQIVQDGHNAEIRSRVCSIDVGGGCGVIRTIVPSAFVASLAEQLVEVSLRQVDGQTSIQGWEQTEVVGARLDNDQQDSLPTLASDPRVFDADGDGEPGVTIRIRGLVSGEIYLVQRGWSRLRTTTVSGNQIAGHIDWATEQNIIGATQPALQNAPPTSPDPSDRRNHFLAVRVDASTTCEDIVDNESHLFER